MKVSKYVLRISLSQDKEKEILFSTLTKKMVIIKKDDAEKLFSRNLKTFSNEYLDRLKDSGII